MPVKTEIVEAENLQTKIQEAKDRGEKILALCPSTLKRNGKIYLDVQAYILVTQ